MVRPNPQESHQRIGSTRAAGPSNLAAQSQSLILIQAGRTAGDTKLTKAGEAARMLARPMGIASSDRSVLRPILRPTTQIFRDSSSQESPGKRDALFFLANATFKVYFALKNLRLCDTVINSTQGAAASLDIAYPKSDRVAFAYYRGRIYLYQRRLVQVSPTRCLKDQQLTQNV